MTIRPGVDIAGIKPELVLALMIVEGVFRDIGCAPTITSVPGSHHHTGWAVELQTRNIPAEKRDALAAALESQIGGQFDVAVENDYIHLEFYPK